jgi:hypothetical protein
MFTAIARPATIEEAIFCFWDGLAFIKVIIFVESRAC